MTLTKFAGVSSFSPRVYIRVCGDVDPERMRDKAAFTLDYHYCSICCAMDSRFLFALSLLCVLVDCQTFPYVSLSTGAGLPNHSYVDLGTVGMGSTSVWCRTDLMTCCRNIHSPRHSGQWFFPDGVALQTGENTYVFQEEQRVELRRANSGTSQTGIYRCEIPTNAVHNNTDISVRATVYVGLYTTEGKFVS